MWKQIAWKKVIIGAVLLVIGSAGLPVLFLNPALGIMLYVAFFAGLVLFIWGLIQSIVRMIAWSRSQQVETIAEGVRKAQEKQPVSSTEDAKRFCKDCGQSLEAGTKFCSKCGAKLM